MRTQELINGSQTAAELFCKAIVDQAQRIEGLPYVLNFAPLAQVNPFQRLLYCRAAAANFAVVPAVHLDDLAPVKWSGRGVIHLHWLASILNGTESMEEANVKIENFQQKLHGWRDNGYKIVWTMHNVLPHNTVLKEAEIALRKVVVAHSDCVHILAQSSIDEARQYFDIPDSKVFHVPHPSYEGWYANVDDAQNARLELGIEPDAFTFVQFGSLQRYKGVVELVEAFRRVQSSFPKRLLRLIIAGMPADKQYVAEILQAIATNPAIRLIQTSVPEREIQTLVNAADVMVAPYINSLNSGVAMLAATFGKSLVAPNTGGVAEIFQSDPSLLYDSGDPGGLLKAMERALTYKVEKEVFTSIMEVYKPSLISTQFFQVLLERLFPEKKAAEKETSDG